MNSPTKKQRLEGLRAAQVAINGLIKEARSACQPYGKRQKLPLAYWRGRFDGLVTAKCMLALADFPDRHDNAEQIKQLLSPLPTPNRAQGEPATDSAKNGGVH